MLHIVANGLTGQAGCVFTSAFILLAKPNTGKTKYTHRRHTHTHTKETGLFSYFPRLYFLLFSSPFGCCDFCCTNFVISLTFTCHTTTAQLAQIESIETLCLHFRRSKLHSICCLPPGRRRGKLLLRLTPTDKRQHDAKQTGKCEPQRMRARVHPGTRVTRIDIRFRLHECQKLFSTSSRFPDSCERTNGRAEAGTTRRRNATPKKENAANCPNGRTNRKLFLTESNAK